MPTSAGIFSKLGRNNGGHFSRTFRGNMVLTVPSVFTFVFQNWSDNFVNAALGNRESKPGESKPRWWALACTKGIQKLKQWASGWQLKSSHIEPWSFHSDHLTELHKRPIIRSRPRFSQSISTWLQTSPFCGRETAATNPSAAAHLSCVYMSVHTSSRITSLKEGLGEKNGKGMEEKRERKKHCFRRLEGWVAVISAQSPKFPSPRGHLANPFG